MLVTHSHLTLIERLDRHLLLRSRVESLLAVVEDAAGDCEQANVAERRVIEELRQMGNRTGGRAVKKTVLVHDLWSDHGDGTPLAQRDGD